jgi:hypothetical protein
MRFDVISPKLHKKQRHTSGAKSSQYAVSEIMSPLL